ncbi:MAG: hypothetical protein OQK99_11540 [Gammaproteobacteria bacterium]|jgi:hypothetical protein|nr:hypothetical protein [Gammaproteobacteria bacterium]
MQEPSEEKDGQGAHSARKELLRKVVIFQFKLFVDGIRDLILVPISLGAAALDLLSGTNISSGNFASVLNLGRRSERYIDLFGERENLSPEEISPQPEPGLDELLGMLEVRVRDRYRKDGAAASAQEALETLRTAAIDMRGKKVDQADDPASSRPDR